MPGNAMPSRATRVLLPTTLLLSGLTYLAAFIAASVELDHARALNSLLCAPRRRTSTAPPPPGCRPYLLAAWAVAVPAAALSLLFVAVTTALLRRPRRPRRAALLAPALLLAGFWLAVLCVGWVPPRGAGGTDPAYFVPARDFAVAVSGAPDGPLTGGFAWAVRFYEYVFGGGSDLFLGAADAWEPMARAGLAGVILCTMAFVWSVLGAVVLATCLDGIAPRSQVQADEQVVEKAPGKATHVQGVGAAKNGGLAEVPERNNVAA